MKKMANMSEMAERMLGCRIAVATEDDPISAQIEAAFRGHRKSPELTVAQAIVLAQGRKALNGDKSAAEFLQRLTGGADGMADEPATIRVQLRSSDGNVMEGWDDAKNAQ